MSQILFSTRRSLILAEKIASSYGEALSSINFIEFKDGEYNFYFKNSISGMNIFIIGSIFPPADNFMELLLICDAVYHLSVNSITLIIPYLGWGRQDKKEKLRSSLSAKLVTKLISTAGATKAIVMDLHSNQIQGFFEIPVDQLSFYNIFIKYLQFIKVKNLTISSTDFGGAKRAKNYANSLEADIIICYKERNKTNEVENINCIGEIKNKNVVLIDDIVDTSGTLIFVCNFIKQKGACSINALITHPVLSGKSYEKIESSFLNELLLSDSIPFKKKLSSKIKILSCAAILADVIIKKL